MTGLPDQLQALPAGIVHLQGSLGKALDRIIAQRLKTIDYFRLVDIFRNRDENDDAWRCEFWGKIVRSAVFAWRATGDDELRRLIDVTVWDMLSTQTADGRISSYPDAKQLGGWDIWGRKYVLVGLIAYYREINTDEKILAAILRMSDDLLRQAGALQDYGQHYGMAAASLLRCLVEIYEISGREDYLNAARKLNQVGCCHLHNIFTAAEIGVMPSEIGNGKAYEMTSCFQGLTALYRVQGGAHLFESVMNYYQAVRDLEIFITGTGGMKDGNGEFWYNGKLRQVRCDCGGMGETCVTVTWLCFCENILRVSGVSSVADEMERSFYNALLGSLSPEGDNFTHVNPFLTGDWKRSSTDQMRNAGKEYFDGHDCCRAQGPMGFAVAPLVAVMKSASGYVVNLYEDMTVEGILRIEGGYPENGTVRVIIMREGCFDLALRIPKEYSCRVDGVIAASGMYRHMNRDWRKEDRIELEFDMLPRKIASPCGKFHAWMRGPSVLASPQAKNKQQENIIIRQDALIDYASAGNRFTHDHMFTVWHTLSQSWDKNNRYSF